MRLGPALVFVLASGCPERRELPRPRADVAARADAGPALLTIGRDHVLDHGVARLEDRQLVIRMTDTVGPCGIALEQTSTASLSIEVPPGPGGRFFASAPLFFEPGAKVAGVVVVEQIAEGEPSTRIAGRFEAEICPR